MSATNSIDDKKLYFEKEKINMNVNFTYRGMERPENRIVQINDAQRLVYRNFSGAGDRFSREGDRDFCVVIPDAEIADALMADKSSDGVGWNVKIKPAREDGGDPFMFLKVKVKFGVRPPAVYLKTGDNMVRLDEDTIGCLDDMDIASVDMDIRPYDDIVSGRPFRAAYLQSMCVTQDFSRDRFAAEYAERNN
jgi:hypothetical protein